MTDTFEFSDEAQIVQVFNYAPDTHEYLGASDAYIQPNTGLPANSTMTAPPENTRADRIYAWTGLKWMLTENHRGTVVYDVTTGFEQTMVKLGPIPKGLTTIKPSSDIDKWDGNTWIPDLELARAQRIKEVKSMKVELTEDRVIIDGIPFNSDPNARIQQMTLTRMGEAGTIPDGFLWQNKDNDMVELTNEMASKFESETMQHDIRLFSTASSHIEAIKALTDVESIRKYDISSGWII